MMNENTDKRRGGRLRREIWQWIVTIACTLLAVLIVRTYVFELIVVDGSSMSDTLYTGDRLFVTKFDYIIGEPMRGEVVICHYPGSDKNYVKRIVGLPGDTVEIAGGVTYLNGEAMDEHFIAHAADREYGPVTLGADEYFVMGDNRSGSRDSRSVGPLTRSQLVGHVRYRIYPFGSMGEVAREYDAVD